MIRACRNTRQGGHGTRGARALIAGMGMVVFCAGGARANDTAAELIAGGLVMVRTDAVRIQREDLHLTPGEVRVRYEMRNSGTEPVTLRVAFPLPELPVDSIFKTLDVPTRNLPNFLGFTVRANEKYVDPDVEIRAILPDGSDIAARLRDIGGWSLVLSPRMFVNTPRAGALAAYDIGPHLLDRLRDIGAIDGGDGTFWPRWTTHVTFHWRQTFGPGVTIIEHRYQPSVGRFYFTTDDDRVRDGLARDPNDPTAAYCVDAVSQSIIQDVADLHPGRVVFARTIGYILKTGANWAGPIEEFHLTVDGTGGQWRFEPVRLVAACAEIPLRRSGPTRLEGSARNYIPKADLRVLLLTDPPAP